MTREDLKNTSEKLEALEYSEKLKFWVYNIQNSDTEFDAVYMLHKCIMEMKEEEMNKRINMRDNSTQETNGDWEVITKENKGLLKAGDEIKFYFIDKWEISKLTDNHLYCEGIMEGQGEFVPLYERNEGDPMYNHPVYVNVDKIDESFNADFSDSFFERIKTIYPNNQLLHKLLVKRSTRIIDFMRKELKIGIDIDSILKAKDINYLHQIAQIEKTKNRLFKEACNKAGR